MNRPELTAEIWRQLAANSLSGFVVRTLPGYRMGWVQRCICRELDLFLQDVVDGNSPRLMITMPPRHGKLCADDTPVLTPEGWKSHGDLRAGDFVFHPSGKPVEVLAVGEKACATHRVKLTNGDEIDVHLDHEWRIFSRPQKIYKTVETRFFVEPSAKTGAVRKLESGPNGKRGHRYLYQIDPANALQFAERKHVLPPYVLGVWLGDGTSCAPRINMAPEDARIVKKAFEKAGVPITKEWVHPQTGVVTFSFGSGVPNVRNVFSQELKRLALLNSKHIPEEYLFSGINSRLELLAGLMDTDGSYDAKTNRYRFVTASKRLAEDVAELVRFCGAPVRVNAEKFDERERSIKATQTAYCVSFFPEFAVPCRLKRKSSEGNKKRRAPKKISIASVEALKKPKRGNCIQVDSPDGLYLVGKHLTPTHNSELASRRFPAYALGRYPDMGIICASYSADLATRMNRDVQRVIDDPAYRAIFPGTTIAGKAQTQQGSWLRNADYFEVVGRKGSFRSAGVGGGLTGFGASIAIIDDAIRNRQDADSPTVRQTVWDWYTSTLYTRLAPGGGVIVINTRWHEDDLSGRLLEAQAKGEGDEWRVINFPAIAEQDEEHRKKGEALHPERYPLEALERIKVAIGTRDWEALYQQHPVPDGGAIFKDEWLQRTWLPKNLPAKFDAVIMSWDLAFKNSDASDFVVGQLVGRHGGDYYLLDQLRGRWSFTETVAQVKELAERARIRFPRVAPRILIEDKANGPAVIDALKHEVSGIVPVEPDGSKEARAHAITALFEAGNVLLPDRSLAPWVDEYRLELTRFPSGAHDDQVDATTQALRYLSAGHRLNIAPQLQRQLQGFRFRR
jgi:predicted phage terminase large subunit-like protein